MANLQPSSEALDDTGAWTPFDGGLVTPNTHAAPAVAGISAGMADTVADQGAGSTLVSSLYGGFQSLPADTLTYCISLFIRKDTTTTRYPWLACEMYNGTNLAAGISCATDSSTGGTVVEGGDVIDSGCVNVDATWWRFWFTMTNALNTAFRVILLPAAGDTHSGTTNQFTTGSMVAFGVAVQTCATPTSAPPAYEPNPDYPSIVLSGTAVGGIPEADIVAGNKTIICTLTGSTYIP